MTIHQRLVTSLPDAMKVRTLRNQCRAFMTNYQQPLGFWQQVRWYFTSYRSSLKNNSYRIFLFLDLSAPVGYGALQLHDGELLVTECVAASRRGQGLGKTILEALSQVARQENRPLVAEIWADNAASLRLHKGVGFCRTGVRLHKGADLVTMRWEPR